MNQLKADYQVEELAHTLEVSPSGFYAHQHKPEGMRAQADQALAGHIQTVFQHSRRIYGSPRITAALRRERTLLRQEPGGPAHAPKSIKSTAETAFCSAHHPE